MITLPRPQVLSIEPDPDRLGIVWIKVMCPRCEKVHSHDQNVDGRRAFWKIPHCTRRLDIESTRYVVDLDEPDGDAA